MPALFASRRAYLQATLAIGRGLLAGRQGSAQEPPAAEIKPFQIAVPDAVLTDLRERLAPHPLPQQIDGTAWEYGVPLDYMRELVTYWREKYDWRKQEQRLNAFSQFKTTTTGSTSTISTSAPRRRRPFRW